MKNEKQLRIERGHDSPDSHWVIAGIALAVFFVYLFLTYGVKL